MREKEESERKRLRERKKRVIFFFWLRRDRLANSLSRLSFAARRKDKNRSVFVSFRGRCTCVHEDLD